MSESHHRAHLPWAEGTGLVVLGVVSLGVGLAPWLAWSIVAIGLVWAGYGVALYVDKHPVHWHARR